MQAVSPLSSGWKAITVSAALARGDRVAVDAREDLHRGPVLVDPRRADEDRADGLALDAGEAQVLLEGVHLAPEGVAPRDDVHEPEVRAVEQDQARAGAEDRHARRARTRAAARRGPRARSRASSSSTRRRAGRARRALEIGGHPDLAHVGAERAQHARVRREAALQREDADERSAHQPRLASSCSGSSLRASSDCIAVPEALGRARDARGIGEVRRRLDDRGGARRRVLGLEDARSRRRPPRRRAA